MRQCIDCEVDISNRHHRAIRCEACAFERIRQSNMLRERRKSAERMQGRVRVCLECSVNIDHRGRSAKRCESCSSERLSVISRQNALTYYEENKEAKKAYQREYNKVNKEEISERRRAYRQTPEYKKAHSIRNSRYKRTEKGRKKSNEHWHKRRARQLNQAGVVSANIVEILLREQDGLCVYCFRDFNETLKPTLDHILPLSRDGRHENSNLQLLCLSCNSSKEIEHTKNPCPMRQK